MSQFREIKLEDKEILQEILEKNPYNISEYTFTNLYIWKDYHKFKWYSLDGDLFIISFREPGKIIFYPPCPYNGEITSKKIKKWLEIFREILRRENCIIEIDRSPSLLTSLLEKVLPYCEFSSTIIEDRDNWDYVYEREELVFLMGKKYANIRKKLNKFYRRYEWSYETLNESNIDECLEFHKQWLETRKDKLDQALLYEEDGIQEVLKEFREFPIEGGILRVEGKIVAYTIYEPLNPTTYVCHVEKADINYVGAYQAIFHQFVSSLPPSIKYINREQDLGKPFLRRAKLSYKPEYFIEKWKIIMRPAL